MAERSGPPRWRLLSLLAGLQALAVAQEVAPALGGSALVARLRSSELTAEEAAVLAPQLGGQPIAVRLQGSDALRDQFLDRQKQHGKAAAELAKALAKVVPALLARAAKLADTVDTLRKNSLAISRRDGLTKDCIHQDIDPLVAQLEELAWPTREAACERDATLLPALEALQRQRAELCAWFQAYTASTAGLELHPDAEKHFAKVPPPPAPLPASTLDDEWTAWTLLALPLSARDHKTLEANEALRATSDPEEFAGTIALNRVRYLLGLPLLRIDEKLTHAARDHSADMATLGFFDHTSPVAGKRTPGDRAARFGTSANAENIAAGQDTGAGAIRAWWYSPGHHRNMLGNHGRTGLGHSAQLWTQMFGG